jgi:hypothetical protein
MRDDNLAGGGRQLATNSGETNDRKMTHWIAVTFIGFLQLQSIK